MKISDAIRGYRERNKMTLRQAAKEIGIHHSILWKIENGQDETAECWPAIIRWLFSK